MILVIVCAAVLAVWLARFPGALRKFKMTRCIGLAGCVLVIVLAVGVLVIAGKAQVPGPTSITSSGLADLATSQAIQDVNPDIVRVVCPRGSFAIGAAIICRADYRRRSQALNVKLHANEDGALYVDVHAE